MRALLAHLAVATLAVAGVAGAASHAIDHFADVAAWKAAASDGARASVHAVRDADGPALRLDFDLGGTAGYALAARPVSLDLPEDYEIAFDLRADAPINNLQFKLVDASGENVWWWNRPDFEFAHEWRRIAIKKRQIRFAWGPTKDRELRHAARIEIVVAAGRGGGSGSLFVRNLEWREREPSPASWPVPSVQASSAAPGSDAAFAVDGKLSTAWQSDPASGELQWLVLDFGRPREFGGLVLRWNEAKHASRYDVQFSDDALNWRTVRSVTQGRGGPDALLLPESETRYVRLALQDGPDKTYALAEVEVRDLAFGESPNAFFEALARESPRGTYPRGFSGEQPYWTIVGVDGGRDTGLLSEDGALEVAKGGFSIEPFVLVGSRVVTWADVQATQSLQDGYLPVPSVMWRQPEWHLRVTAFASGSRDRSQLYARYDVENLTDAPLRLQLVLAVRPAQVNPPAQFLNAPSGVSPIRDIAWNGRALAIDHARHVFPLRAPSHVGMFPFDAGPVTKRLAEENWAGSDHVSDPFGYASAALGFPIALAPRQSATIAVATPLSGNERPTADASIDVEQARVASYWRKALERVAIEAPADAQMLVDTMKTALAHLLVTRDGPILRPGARAYARSWIRDGAMIGEALLRLGRADVVADYVRWYAPHQFADGNVPCCVDARGADPVAENDSEGEFVFLVSEAFRYTGDRALLAQMWPHVDAAMRYLERLRQSGRTAAVRASNRALFGLLPASISHEGYSEKPMHSYWDDLWALKGYDGAIAIAEALGKNERASAWRAQRDEFARDIEASFVASAAEHGVDYLTGAAELGDFDPTSSTIAFAPAGDARAIPAQLLAPTFERYWREFVERRDGRTSWEEYTPYEIRNVDAFVRLGWRERATELLSFFMAGRRPAAWNQWAEVVGREPRKVRFVGDMPHAWVASDFIRAALDSFAYERGGDDALVLAGGVPPAWLDGHGIAIAGLHTPFGVLRYVLRRANGALRLHVDGGLRVPQGGVVLPWPFAGPPGAARVNGKPAKWRDRELRIRELPADVEIDVGATR